MKHTLVRFLGLAVMGMALVVAAVPARAVPGTPVTFNFTFAGGGATATGNITFADLSLLTNTDSNTFTLGGPEILSINLTVSGTASGNGAYTAADFESVAFWTPYALDFGQELFGQTPSGQPNFWGSDSTEDGDFNFFLSGVNPSAPNGANYFTLQANGGNDEVMMLTSMTMVAVPEPSTYAAIAGLAALGLAALRRRRHA